MSFTKKVAWNTIIQTIGKVIGIILGIATVAIMTRYLGREGFGAYTTILAFLQFFSLLFDLGLYLVLTNEIARPEVDRQYLLNNFFTLRLVSAIFFLLAVSAAVWAFPYPLLIKEGVIVASLSLFFISLIQILTSLFQQELKMDRVAIGEIIGKVIFLALVILAVYYQLGLLYVLVAMVLGSLANFLSVYLASRHYLRLSLSFDIKFWLKILQKSWPVALSSVFVLVYFKADTLILSLFRSQAEVGIYGAVYKILEVLIAFPALFMGLVSPVLALTSAAGDWERFNRVFQKAFDFFSLISWPMVWGTIILARPILSLIAGPDFVLGAGVLQILIVATGVIFFAHLPGYTIVAIGRQKEMVRNYLLAALGALIAYLVFIPTYSYYGAAVVTLLVETFIFVMALRIVLRQTPARLSLAVFGKAFLSSCLMALAIYFFRGQNLFILIIGGGAIYFSLLYLLRGISREVVREIISA